MEEEERFGAAEESERSMTASSSSASSRDTAKAYTSSDDAGSSACVSSDPGDARALGAGAPTEVDAVMMTIEVQLAERSERIRKLQRRLQLRQEQSRKLRELEVRSLLRCRQHLVPAANESMRARDHERVAWSPRPSSPPRRARLPLPLLTM